MARLSRCCAVVCLVFMFSVRSSFAGCGSDADCSLNGICDKSTGACACDPAWTSDDCSLMNLLPAPVCRDKYNLEFPCGFRQRTNTSWGGSALPYNGKWYMATAFMVNGCSLSDWDRNSAVIIVEADTPSGPYNFSSVAIEPWAHNPAMVKTPDGQFVIFTLGNGVPHGGPPKHCRSASPSSPDSTSVSVSVSDPHPVETNPDGTVVMNFTVHYADSPLGPFTAHNTSILNFPPPPSTFRNWNPAPVVFKNGSVRIQVHTDVHGTWSGEILVQADSWKGPYTMIHSDILHCVGCAEDADMYVDPRGNWHSLYHFTDDGHWQGGHSFSADGFNWSNITRAYNLSIPMENGKTLEARRRERPKLIFDEAGNPTHLANGIATDHAGTFTVTIPLGTTA